MKKLLLMSVLILSASPLAYAQTYQNTGTSPVFYNQNGTPINPSGSQLPAGNYYNQQGQQVYYNGTGGYYAVTPASPGVPNSSVTVAGSAATGPTPIFYQQNGTIANPGGTSLPAGNYYNQQGQQVYYYGNGTYYNPSAGTYGGQAFGTSGTVAAAGTITPSVPNTGAGGNSLYSILILLACLTVAAGGMTYLAKQKA